MKKFLVFATVAALATSMVSAYPDPYQRRFSEWMHKHGKSYSAQEFHGRFRTWKQNMHFIENFQGSHEVAMNEFGDLSSEEFGRIYNGFRAPAVFAQVVAEERAVDTVSLPSSVDWRTKGAVTGVKNQGQCGSCWSFSTTGSTEGAHAISTGSLVSLSEQNLVDCSGSYGNNGCNGGLMDNAFQYIINNNGIDTESCYPYTASQGTCQYSTSCIGATLSSYQDVTSGSESALQTAVANVGPISVAIDAGQSSFQFYSGGVYSDSGCGNQPSDLDHGVLVVGYGTSNGQDFWWVKNSWGNSWGLSGYIMMARNDNNMCGIATMPSYPIV